MHYDTTPAVDAISQIHFEGDIIPKSWYSHIKMPSGLPDMVGMVILARVIYWYRQTDIKDPDSDTIIGRKKRFYGHKLQQSYSQFSKEFGFGKEQVREAIKRLVDRNLVTLELKDIETKEGLTLRNTMFIEPVASEILRITHARYEVVTADISGGKGVSGSDPIRVGQRPDTCQAATRYVSGGKGVSGSDPIRVGQQPDTCQAATPDISASDLIRVGQRPDYTKTSTKITTQTTTEITDKEGEGNMRVPAHENPPIPSEVTKSKLNSVLENSAKPITEINKLPFQPPPRPIKTIEPQGLIPKNFQPAEDTIKAILSQVGSSYAINTQWVSYQLHIFRSIYEGKKRTELDWDLKFVTWCLKQAPEDYTKGLLKVKNADSTTNNQLQIKELSHGREKLSSIDAEAEAKRIRRERREAEQRAN